MSVARFEIEEVEDIDSAWPELVALFLDFEDYNAGFLSRGLRQDWKQRWHESLSRQDKLVLLARRSDVAVGYLVASIRRDFGLFDEVRAHISGAFVRPEYRSRGLGRRLLRRAEEWSRARGATDLTLEVYSANKQGVRFWTLAGFELEFMGMTKSLAGGPTIGDRDGEQGAIGGRP